MRSDTVEFWNDVWSTMDHTFADHDELLAKHTGHLKPGRHPLEVQHPGRPEPSIWDVVRAETPYGWPSAVGK